MTTKHRDITINQITTLDDELIAVVCGDKSEALAALKRNPKARVMEQENGEVVLVYGKESIDFKRAIVKGR